MVEICQWLLQQLGSISRDISETVQDRNTVAMEAWQEIVCGLSNGIIASDLEGHFCFFKSL